MIDKTLWEIRFSIFSAGRSKVALTIHTKINLCSSRRKTMQITSTNIQRPQYKGPQAAVAATASEDSSPKESFSFSSASDKAGFIGLGLASGAVGIGAPAALAMGSAKSFMNGSPLLGTGLAVASIATGATVGMVALMGAAMSSDAGGTAGFNSYLAGGAITTAAAGFAIF
jgi:hypothetical protein